MRRTWVAIAALVVSVLASCTGRTSTAPAVLDQVGILASILPTTSDARVVLVTIDGARWQDVFEGSDPALSGAPHVPPDELMPRTYALLAARGVALGADRKGCATVHTAGGANVSLPGYQENFTGRPSWCLDNDCDGVSESVMDEAAAARVDGVASIGAWGTLERAVSGGGAGVFVAAGRTWPARAPASSPLLDALAAAGERADPFPGHDDYRPDEQTAALALEYFRVASPAFFHVGLGDTDEWGHRGDYPSYLAALRRADALIGALADTLDTMGEVGRRTTIIVTPDHGRNSDFRDHGALRMESGRTFLLLFGDRVTARGIGCPADDITLADIAPTIRELLGLPRVRGEGAGSPIAEIR
jgi:hypothetical protein